MRWIILVVFVAGLALLTMRPLSSGFGSAPMLRPPSVVQRGGTTTILVLGLDQRGSEVTRSDTMLLVRVGPLGRPPTVLSIPRDLWVQIPGHGEDRVNTAYVWGELDQDDGAGLARRTIEQNFGVPVDRVAVVDFGCFERAIDAAGGVSVDVPRRLVDPTHPQEDGSTAPVTFEPGQQRMSGQRALQYARMRAPDSDFGRIRRQQQIVSALGQRSKDPRVAAAVAQTLVRRCPGSGLDLTTADLISLGVVAAGGGEPVFRVIDESMVNPTTLPSGAAVLLPRWEVIRPAVAQLFSSRA
jgi:LCP family protein required for cell wall assembly